jgi:hypothetical protein
MFCNAGPLKNVFAGSRLHINKPHTPYDLHFIWSIEIDISGVGFVVLCQNEFITETLENYFVGSVGIRGILVIL